MLSQKESSLLQELKSTEQICVEKYHKYSSDASAPQLKSLFQQIGSHEQQHLQTIDQIISNGTAPAMGSNQSGKQQANNAPQAANGYSGNESGYTNDSYLCTDALSTEKFVSSNYNISIFEFKDTAIRDALNHIQKEEQQHGQMIYDYMAGNGMYN